MMITYYDLYRYLGKLDDEQLKQPVLFRIDDGSEPYGHSHYNIDKINIVTDDNNPKGVIECLMEKEVVR